MKTRKRLKSLDALRGFDMFFIMGGATLITLLCTALGHPDCWLAETMTHVKWNGLAHHDTIFPLFLFIAGMSFPLSYTKQRELGLSSGKIYLKIFKRAAILIILGVIYNGGLAKFTDIRVASVLGRIGFAWMMAAILFINFNRKARIGIAAGILIGYWLLLRFISAPDAPGADPYSMEGNLVGFIDRNILPGDLYYGYFDPEGIFSAVPAIVTAMLGMFTGEFISIPEEKISGKKKTVYMIIATAVMLGIGLLWSLDFPINKSLWTSSFVLVVGAYSLGMFAVFYYIIDVLEWTRWAFVFEVIGLNSITIYMIQRFVSFDFISRLLFGGLSGCLPPEWGNVIICLGGLTCSWLLLYFLHRKKIYLKI